MPSPFRVGGPVTGEFFTDRAAEVDEIHRAMTGRARLLVRGLRRQGKTSAIAQAATRFERDGGLVLWMDLATMAGLSDLRDRLLSSLPENFFGAFEGLKKLQPVLDVSLDPSTGTHTYSFRVAARAAQRLGVREQTRVIMESIDRRAADRNRPMVVVIDEIQAIATLDEERADWFLRDLTQLAGHVGFICAGSQPSILRSMTDDRHAAFFRFFAPGPEFDPIEKEHLARWIASRLSGAGVRCSEDVARRIADTGERTQDIMQLADQVYASGVGGGLADEATLDAAMAAILRKESDRYLRLWNDLTRNQRLVARALAAGATSLYARETALPLAASSVHRALEGLRTREVLLDAPGPERLDDPWFREWVMRFAMADSVADRSK